MSESQVTIIGAGPAGISAALFLDRFGIPVTLIDKDIFPRDKVCGDCLGGYALSVLHQLGDRIFESFIKSSEKISGQGVHFFGPEHQKISIQAVNLVKDKINEVALCRRYDFDNFLLAHAKECDRITILTGLKVAGTRRSGDQILLLNDRGEIIHTTSMLIMAAGSNLSLVRELTGKQYNDRDQAAGIRTYFRGINKINPEGYIELHFLKELAPGYLWIFPLPDGQANVGIGLRSDIIKKKQLDLKGSFNKILYDNPYFKQRFSEAEQLGDVKGFPLALSMKNHRISGERFLLAGDSAHLIEPLFGEGIGHAMYSGKFAAEHVVRCIDTGNFSAEFNKQYDKAVYRKLGSTLNFSRSMHRLAAYPGLINMLFNRIKRNHELEDLLFGIINGGVPKTPWNGIRFISRLLLGK